MLLESTYDTRIVYKKIIKKTDGDISMDRHLNRIKSNARRYSTETITTHIENQM